jgi:hypothetical protein
MDKLINISIPVAFIGPGNVILNKMVLFHIYQEGHAYIAAPMISTEQRRLADLPQELVFEYSGTTIMSSRGEGETKMDVLKDILQELTFKTNS